jgi:hypothetical protein
MIISPPEFETLNKYYKEYWKHLQETDLLQALKDQTEHALEFMKTIPENKVTFQYAKDKWMVKEVIGHISDAERVLSYRALVFARNDKRELAAFDEDKYMEESNFKNLSMKSIMEEWLSVRKATLSLFTNLSEKCLDNPGLANGNKVSPRILLYFILVHERHHLEIIKQLYLSF